MKLREGDQPLPTVNDLPDIQSMVIDDITARRQVGIERYGTALQAHNGRDMLRDLYEELIDAAIYIRGVIEERDHPPEARRAMVCFECRDIVHYRRSDPPEVTAGWTLTFETGQPVTALCPAHSPASGDQ